MPLLSTSNEQEGQVDHERGILLKFPHLRLDSMMSRQSLYDRK